MIEDVSETRPEMNLKQEDRRIRIVEAKKEVGGRGKVRKRGGERKKRESVRGSTNKYASLRFFAAAEVPRRLIDVPQQQARTETRRFTTTAWS